MDENYLISVVSGGKVVELYYSEDLSELNTIKAMHRGCEIEARKMKDPYSPPKEYVSDGNRRKLTKNGKPWANRVQCVETGEVWPSVADCSKATGIPLWSLRKSIQAHCCASGRHFFLLSPTNSSE